MGSTRLGIADLVHELETLQRLFDGHAYVLLSQWARPEAVVKVEEALVVLDPQEGCHVIIVWQGGRESDQPDHLLCGLYH